MQNYQMITDINDSALSVFKDLKEAQLKHYYEPDEGLFICESPRLIRRALDAGYVPESLLAETSYLEDSADSICADIRKRYPNVPIYSAPMVVLVQITGYHLTDGMLCAMRRKPLPDATTLLGDAKSRCGTNHLPRCGTNHLPKRIVVLEDVENPTNVGAIFRSAAALGMDAILLTEGCADPLYRRAARVSMGGVFQIPWTYLPSLLLLKEAGYKTAALALSDHSISIDDQTLMAEERLTILLGNENNGLLPETIAQSDYIVKIPMSNDVDSLNVAAASAIAFWQLR